MLLPSFFDIFNTFRRIFTAKMPRRIAPSNALRCLGSDLGGHHLSYRPGEPLHRDPMTLLLFLCLRASFDCDKLFRASLQYISKPDSATTNIMCCRRQTPGRSLTRPVARRLSPAPRHSFYCVSLSYFNEFLRFFHGMPLIGYCSQPVGSMGWLLWWSTAQDKRRRGLVICPLCLL